MIPSTMCPWWIHSLTETDQDWCQFYRGHISLALPRPLFDDRILGMTNFLKDVGVGSGHPGSLVKGWKNDKEFLPTVMCPFGCSEYCFNGNHVPWDLVIQRLLLKVLLLLIQKISYLHVQHMWQLCGINTIEKIMTLIPSCKTLNGRSDYPLLYLSVGILT